MKKFLALLLVVLMAFSMFALSACNGETEKTPDAGTQDGETQDGETEGDETEGGNEPSGVINKNTQYIIGNTTELAGDWESSWTNGAADYDVLKMITGYEPVTQTSAGEYIVDKTVVKEYTAVENADGSKTYTVTINSGLKYSDGVEVTAKDYVARLLLFSCKAITYCGNKGTGGMTFVGYKDFQAGGVFSGVRLIDEYTFSIQIDPEYLPYFYDITYLAIAPLPRQMWFLEGLDVADDGEGAYLTGAELVTMADVEVEDEAGNKTTETQEVATEAFKAKIDSARFESANRVCSGPYKIESYDEAAKQAVLVINENYAGNHEGKTANIGKIIYVKAEKETQMDALKTGAIDILFQLAEGAEITAALDIVEEDSAKFTYSTYLRAGYGKLMFICDVGPVYFPEVRYAIASLLDRNDFASAFTGGYGSIVHGPYGLAMWMYQEAKETLEAELNPYPYSLDTAVDYLVAAGFTLAADGTDYVEGVRYKDVTDVTDVIDYSKNITLDDGRILMPCEIEWLCSEGNSVSALLTTKLKENPDTAAAGVVINKTEVTFSELLNWMYRDGDAYQEKIYGMTNLATNFTPVYDQSYEWSLDPEIIALGYNLNHVYDTLLDQYSMDMVYDVETGDNAKYLDLWTKYILRWNELLPELPLYSNLYHDVYTSKLKGYDPNPYWGFAEAVCDIWVEE